MSNNGQLQEREATPGVTSAPLSYDQIFSVLSNHRRRYVLHALRNEGGSSTLGHLARQVAAWENDVEPGEVTRKQRKRIYTALRQTHLPMMARTGAIRYDSARGTVQLAGRAAPILDYLDADLRSGTVASRPTLALVAAGCLAVVALTWAGIFPVVLPRFGYALAIAAVFLLTSIRDPGWALAGLRTAHPSANVRNGEDASVPPPR
jgi:hypothetical protein